MEFKQKEVYVIVGAFRLSVNFLIAIKLQAIEALEVEKDASIFEPIDLEFVLMSVRSSRSVLRKIQRTYSFDRTFDKQVSTIIKDCNELESFFVPIETKK